MTIAAITGVVAAGGLEMALVCDVHPGGNAQLVQAEIKMGLYPGSGGAQRLTRLIGISNTKELILSGRLVDAEEALRIGFVNRIVAADDIFDAAVSWASEFAASMTGPVQW